MSTLSDGSLEGTRRFLPAPGRRPRRVVKHGDRRYRWDAVPLGWKGVLLRCAAAAGLACGPATASHAAFGLSLGTVQSASMGGASLAHRANSEGLFLNSAAPAGLRGAEAYMVYSQLYAGLSGIDGIGHGLVTVGMPTPVGAFSVGLSNLRSAGLLEERVIAVNYSRRASESVALGITGKHLFHRYLTGSDASAASDPVFARGRERSAVTFDAGTIVSFRPNLDVGFTLRNITRPDVGLATVDRVPLEYQAGLSYTLSPWSLRLTADYAFRALEAGTLRQRMRPGLGMEKTMAEGRVSFRAGITPDQISGGAGVLFPAFGFDYSFTLTRGLVADNAGTHRVGIRYRFGDGEKQ